MQKTVRENLIVLLIAFGLLGVLAAKKYVDQISDQNAKDLNDTLSNSGLPEVNYAGPGSPKPIIG